MSALVPFSSSFVTADGFPLLVGGLCPSGEAAACISHLTQLNQLTLGDSRDCVVIDVQLSRLLQKAAPPGVRFVAASVLVPDANQLCGGVAGDLFREEQSADGAFSPLADGVCGFALPGAGAMLMVGDAAEAHRIYKFAAKTLVPPLTRSSIHLFLEQLPPFSGSLLFVTDGSGGSVGCMYTRSPQSDTLLWLSPTEPAKRGDASA